MFGTLTERLESSRGKKSEYEQAQLGQFQGRIQELEEELTAAAGSRWAKAERQEQLNATYLGVDPKLQVTCSH